MTQLCELAGECPVAECPRTLPVTSAQLGQMEASKERVFLFHLIYKVLFNINFVMKELYSQKMF